MLPITPTPPYDYFCSFFVNRRRILAMLAHRAITPKANTIQETLNPVWLIRKWVVTISHSFSISLFSYHGQRSPGRVGCCGRRRTRSRARLVRVSTLFPVIRVVGLHNSTTTTADAGPTTHTPKQHYERHQQNKIPSHRFNLSACWRPLSKPIAEVGFVYLAAALHLLAQRAIRFFTVRLPGNFFPTGMNGLASKKSCYQSVI